MPMTKDKYRFIVSVLIADRVGILRDITSALTDLGANIDAVSQTVVEGYFTVTLAATFASAIEADTIQTAIRDDFGADACSVGVRSCPSAPAARRTVEGDRYVITISGEDRPGVLKAITSFLAAKEINIEDWYLEFRGTSVTQIGEITMPHMLDIKQVQDELVKVLAPLGFAGRIQHENIFRAINEIGPTKALLGGPDA